jgi:demethylmenaquinone methyltransferase/2-methoxy-6-polyprenyl-1,4-benzoquinol methylase
MELPFADAKSPPSELPVSTPLTEPDPEGNTYQIRKLADGSSHRVLKNYPNEFDLCELVAPFGVQPTFTIWQYYWAFEYVLR